MFNPGALTILTLFNLLALTQLIATTTAPAPLPHLLRQRTATLSLIIPLSALALGLLIHQPEISIATITTAACINLLILLGPLTRHPQGPQTLNQLPSLNGLARLHLTSESAQPPAIQPAHPTPPQPIRTPPTPTIRGPRPITQTTATPTTSRPLPNQEPAQAPSPPRPQTTTPPTPHRTYTVPHRPNRITTSLGALQLTPESANALNLFTQSAARKTHFAALATRTRLVHPIEHNQNVLPLILRQPDPAWQTTLGRIAALARSA